MKTKNAKMRVIRRERVGNDDIIFLNEIKDYFHEMSWTSYILIFIKSFFLVSFFFFFEYPVHFLLFGLILLLFGLFLLIFRQIFIIVILFFLFKGLRIMFWGQNYFCENEMATTFFQQIIGSKLLLMNKKLCKWSI